MAEYAIIVAEENYREVFTMSNLLDTAAVGTKSGADAEAIMAAYIATAPAMVLSHSLDVQPVAQRPKGTGAGDGMIEPK